jgi:hypothetical protein
MRDLLIRFLMALGTAAQLASAPGGPCLAAEPAALIFADEQGLSRSLSSAELAKLARKTIKVTGSDNQTSEYEGIPLATLLEHCGVVLGKELRGPRVANYLLIEATDGYRVSLAIAEVDPATTDKVVLLADKKNGVALPEKEAPWRLVIPDDKRPVRWVRMVQRISVRAPATEAAK